jgi:uncharacterized membrane protein YvlD (DUF360 family)
MITRIVLAVIVAVVVGLFLTALVGPLLVFMKVPVAVLAGDFFIQWGWVLGVAAGVWYFAAAGPIPPMPWNRP